MEVVCENGEILQPLYDELGDVYACVSVYEGKEGATVRCCKCEWEGCPMRGCVREGVELRCRSCRAGCEMRGVVR